MVDHRAVAASVDDERVEHQRRRDLGRRVDEPIVVLELEVRLVGGARVAVDDVPSGGRRDVERDRIGLVSLDVHEQRRAVPVRVRGIEHAERARQRVGEHAIAQMHGAGTAGLHDPARPVRLVPAQRPSGVVGDAEVLQVAGEIHPRVPAGRPDRKLQRQLSRAHTGDVDGHVVQVRRRIGHGDPVGDAERLSNRHVRDDAEQGESGAERRSR